MHDIMKLEEVWLKDGLWPKAASRYFSWLSFLLAAACREALSLGAEFDMYSITPLQ